MESSLLKQVNKILRDKERHRKWISVVLCLAIFVSLGTAAVFSLSGIAMTHQEKVLDCSYEAPTGDDWVGYAAHIHNDDCRDADGVLVCPLEEVVPHVHDASCYTTVSVLSCTQDTEGHKHDESCYEQVRGELTCTEESEPHVHGEGCYEPVRGELICTDDSVDHEHDDNCYAWHEELTCTLETEPHEHTDACYAWTPELVCGLEEGEGAHIHTEDCYISRTVLTCEQQALHVHDASCYDENGALVCGQKQMTEHVHGDECFKLVELSEEEIAERARKEKNDAPVSDPSADLESEGYWTYLFSGMERSGNWAKDLLAVAQSQLGYRESAQNFEIDDNQNLKGYTRYGAWYGFPYGDWCAMFVSFCLHYAGVPETAVPRECGTRPWVETLEKRDMYAPAKDYLPRPGDMVFFDFDKDMLADHVGLVSGVNVDEGLLETIEGNRTVAVDRYTMSLYDETILGYGILPENPDAPPEEPVMRFETEEMSDYPAGVFTGTAGDLDVVVTAEEGTFPAGTYMEVKTVDAADVEQSVANAVSGEVVRMQAVDITFYNADGEEIEPKLPVRVSITSATIAQAEQPVVVHVPRDGEATVVDQADEETAEDELVFQTDAFSVYVVAYTVDFEYEVDGQEYPFRLNGGDSVGIRELVEALHVLDAAEIPELPAEGDGAVLSAADAFVKSIETVAFSNEELVKVLKLEADATAGELKQAWDLAPTYSAELTEEQIARMNEKAFRAPDWVLVSLRPFDTVETLTVTMKNGDVWTIRVTDAQLSKDVITASGETFTITVSYGQDAEIPEGAELRAQEVLQDTVAYSKYLNDSAAELNVAADAVTFARFFDIEIVKDGEKIEPKAPVQVEITYKDGVTVNAGESLHVVHFAEEATEVISKVALSEDRTVIAYEQESFSVTGTIVSVGNNLPGGNQYMLLIEYPVGSNQYYIINNDGTLTAVQYSNGTVDVEDPMLWTIEGSNNTGHIYFNTEATGFNWQNTAGDYFRRYLDPSAADGISEETSENITLGRYEGDNIKTGYVVINRDAMANQTTLNYYDNKIYHGAWNDGHCLGVVLDENGTPVRVSGENNWNNAAKVVFASANSVPDVGATTHTVDHIDISISGTSNITVPLAYGTYYYKDAAGNWQAYEVTGNTSLDLTKNDVSIEPEDMKHATIKAYDKNGNELDNAFVVTGYSSNHATGLSTVQVRIEGRFKVANLSQEANRWDYNSNYWKNQRNNNRITYTVSAIKPLTYDLIETDNGYGQLYEKLSDGTYRPLSVTVDVNMSASFDYWDERNECPAVHDEELGLPGTAIHDTWANGGIPDLWGQFLSGMDFVLGGDAEEADARIVAVEITKMIVDASGHLIRLNSSLVQGFDVYGSHSDHWDNVIGVDVPTYEGDSDNYNFDSYSRIHSKDVRVGTDGMGLVYDYDVTPGMYYITEDASQIPDTITDQNGTDWHYRETRIETEYVWRNDEYSGRHVSEPYSDKQNDAYRSIPEVAGEYTGSQYGPQGGHTEYGSHDWEHDGESGTFRNGFLEFYVYNVYEESNTNLVVEKDWENGQAPDGSSIEVVLGRYKLMKDESAAPAENQSAADGTDAASDRGAPLRAEAAPDIQMDNTAPNPTLFPAGYNSINTTDIDVTHADGSGWSKHVPPLSEANGWRQMVDELEVWDSDGNLYVYYIASVIEHGMPEGTVGRIELDQDGNKFFVYGDHMKDQDNTLRVINALPVETDIGILKVEKSTEKTLPGGEFAIQKYKDDTFNETDGEPITGVTDESGRLAIEGLTEGWYKLEETKAPEGYVRVTAAPSFQVKRNVATGALYVEFTDTALVHYDLASQTFTVENEPGAVLPETGGSGTLRYELAGLTLATAATALLCAGRKRRGKGGDQRA